MYWWYICICLFWCSFVCCITCACTLHLSYTLHSLEFLLNFVNSMKIMRPSCDMYYLLTTVLALSAEDMQLLSILTYIFYEPQNHHKRYNSVPLLLFPRCLYHVRIRYHNRQHTLVWLLAYTILFGLYFYNLVQLFFVLFWLSVNLDPALSLI